MSGNFITGSTNTSSPSPSSLHSAPSISALKEFSVSVDRSHRAFSSLFGTPFLTSHEALRQTSDELNSTAKHLNEATQHLVRSQENLKALVVGIKNAQEFLPPTKAIP